MTIEQANALYNSNPKQPYDPYSNTYNEGWKHNPAFSYKNTQAQLNPPPPPRNNLMHHQQPPPIQQKSNLEIMMENLLAQQTNFMAQQGKQNEKTDNAIQQIQAQNKLLESQISQLAHQVGQLSKAPGHFPELQDHPLETVQTEKVVENEIVEEEKKEPTPTPIRPYTPPVPFPQRTISEMPSYAKFLKDMLSNKRKIEENATVSLTAECSAILQNKLPKKLGDPGSYSIPVKLGDIEIKKALCDLGASVSLMPLSICKKLQWVNQNHTYSLQLADRTVKYPLGILEDVPSVLGSFSFHVTL
ncbi:uncharacterized protein LOC130591172 [Beta vulgaris subsp. vulgaris]|uniref:uncharacterized protein LOC130591172 n=1 Tax=Beta vulgaris subsp. vulgaris TaxID=3555 RepID=UPI002548B894|nr:uncharacterized protein LOC130591172 [Beta vulgaris subsp. vulgaris]